MLTRGLGWRPDKPDDRDLSFGQMRLHQFGVAPTWLSLRDRIASIVNQGRLGSCTACAAAQAIRLSHVAQFMALGIPLGNAVQSSRLLSILWAYYFARAREQLQNEDSGANFRLLFSALGLGFPPEEKWPYSDSLDKDAPFRRMPSKAAFRAAYDQREPTVYRRILSVGSERHDDVKRALANGFGVCAGWLVSEAFVDGRFNAATILEPAHTDIAGGHAMLLTGYAPDEYELLSSWGHVWADGGFCHVSPAWVDEAVDLWVVEWAPLFSE